MHVCILYTPIDYLIQKHVANTEKNKTLRKTLNMLRNAECRVGSGEQRVLRGECGVKSAEWKVPSEECGVESAE
jgi:hypothetical protein